MKSSVGGAGWRRRRYAPDRPRRRMGAAVSRGSAGAHSRARRSAITSGLPINNAARLRGDAWDASLLTVPEHQCKPHPSDYSPRGPANLRITKEIDRDTQQVIAYHTHISWEAPERTIWMDGRPHPPAYAPHTWQGFSTGKWEGDMLTITTTHLKIGWIRRNGIPRSDSATVVEHWIRHENYLTWVVIITDPVYLTEPFIRTTDFVADPDQQIAPYPCEIVVEIQRPRGDDTASFAGHESVSDGVCRPAWIAARGGARRRARQCIRSIGQSWPGKRRVGSR